MDNRLHLRMSEPVVATALGLLDGVGPATVAVLTDAFETVGQALQILGAHAAAGTVPKGVKRPVVAAFADPQSLLRLVDMVDREFDETREAGGEILHPGGDGYPIPEGAGHRPVLRIFGAPLPEGPVCGLFGASGGSAFGPAAAARITAALREAGVATATAGDGRIDAACAGEAVRGSGRHVAVLDRGWTPSLFRTGSVWSDVLDGGGTLVGRFGHGTPHSLTTSMEAGDTLVALAEAMVAVRGSEENATRKTVSRTLSAARPLFIVVPPERHMENSDADFIDYAVGHRNAGDLVRLLRGRDDYPDLMRALGSEEPDAAYGAPSGP